MPRKKMNLPYSIRMYWTNFWQLTVHVQQNIFEKALIEVCSPHLYASFGTFCAQIGSDMNFQTILMPKVTLAKILLLNVWLTLTRFGSNLSAEIKNCQAVFVFYQYLTKRLIHMNSCDTHFHTHFFYTKKNDIRLWTILIEKCPIKNCLNARWVVNL